jgi:surfactin synthase thioesterase subunit
LVNLLANDIKQVHAPRYVLFGHSLGGLLAYGCAHRLRQLGGHSPSALLIAGTAAPLHRDDAYLAELRSDADVIEELRRQGGTPAEVFSDPDLLRLAVDTAAADFAVCASFRPIAHQPLTIPIHVYTGRDDNLTARQLSGWTRETVASTSIDVFPGGHFFPRENETALLATITAALSSLKQGAA